jgi:ATP phosphoribosyltransferase
VLAVSPTISQDANKILDKIRFRIQSVLQGRDSRYVLLNAPNEKIEKIIKILPGMKSPTLLPLAVEGWSSVHSVVNRDVYWEVIEELKAAGAEGILVCPIEKMIL